MEPACYLDFEQRALVEQTVEKHCEIKNWKLHAVNARTAHVHAVITSKHDPEIVREQLKAWCTRKLNELNELNASRGAPYRSNWWTEKGSIRSIGDEESLEAVIHYVLFGQ
jgi:REP element-mobilizing transposase RayT